jgi:hypothetical protein
MRIDASTARAITGKNREPEAVQDRAIEALDDVLRKVQLSAERGMSSSLYWPTKEDGVDKYVSTTMRDLGFTIREAGNGHIKVRW